MKCNYIIDVYIDKIVKLCKVCLDMYLFSDFIIGFLGEIDVYFEEIY